MTRGCAGGIDCSHNRSHGGLPIGDAPGPIPSSECNREESSEGADFQSNWHSSEEGGLQIYISAPTVSSNPLLAAQLHLGTHEHLNPKLPLRRLWDCAWHCGLRVPGNYNWKYDTAKRVQLEWGLSLSGTDYDWDNSGGSGGGGADSASEERTEQAGVRREKRGSWEKRVKGRRGRRERRSRVKRWNWNERVWASETVSESGEAMRIILYSTNFFIRAIFSWRGLPNNSISIG